MGPDRRLVSSLALLMAAAAASSQNLIVSPVTSATAEGSGGNIFPFGSPIVRRYQQIHGDLVGVPRLITRLSFRMNAVAGSYTGTRAVDMELYLGHAVPANQASFLFANNYVGPRVLVLPRTIVTMGPQGQASLPGPNPFASMDVVTAVPFPYNGTQPLIWEAVVYANPLAGTTWNGNDAESASLAIGANLQTGQGCVASGQTARMSQIVSMADMGGTLLMNFTVTGGPASTPVLLSMGLNNPNVPIPGLCSNLQTDLFRVLVLGPTDVTGAITIQTPAANTFVLPNTLGGARLFTQLHAIDTMRADPIPVCNSDGMENRIPVANPVYPIDVTRMFNNVGGTLATEAIFFSTLTIGYGLVTQFTY